MKIKELIARLNKFDQELEVVIQNKSCDFGEAVVADSIIEMSAVQDNNYEFYYNIVPDELDSPEYPELKIQKVLWLS